MVMNCWILVRVFFESTSVFPGCITKIKHFNSFTKSIVTFMFSELKFLSVSVDWVFGYLNNSILSLNKSHSCCIGLIAVADPGFPEGGRRPLGGAKVRRAGAAENYYVKVKESGCLAGCAPAAPPRIRQ